MEENKDKEYIAKMFKREDEVINDNVDFTEYINDYIKDLNEIEQEEIPKIDKNFELLECCKKYLEEPTLENLEKFQESLDRSSTMSAPVVYKYINNYKNNYQYKNQCIKMQQILLDHINQNNVNSKMM